MHDDSAFEKFAKWLRVKSKFLLFCVICWGTPMWLAIIWTTRDLTTRASWIVFLGVVCYGGAVVFGLAMWHLWYLPLLRSKGHIQDDI